MPTVERAFVFADLSGYTALTEVHGDAHAAAIARKLAAFARESLVADGEVVKTIGDAVMLALPDVPSAIRAVSLLTSRVSSQDQFLGLRVGLHFGGAELEGGDYFGSVVNLAARVASHAVTGEVLCTREVVDGAASLLGVTFRARGDVRFKNVSSPIAIFEMVLPDDGGVVTDPVCRMRIDPGRAAVRMIYNGKPRSFCSVECAERFRAAPETFG